MRRHHVCAGPSFEKALSQGLKEYGLSSDQVSVSILRRGRKGFFGLFKKPWILVLRRRQEMELPSAGGRDIPRQGLVYNEFLGRYVADVGSRQGVLLQSDGRYELKLSSKTTVRQLLYMNAIINGEILLTKLKSPDAARWRRTLALWAGLSPDEWTTAHKHAFAVATLHYVMSSKSSRIVALADVFRTAPSMDPKELPELPAAWTGEMQFMFEEVYGQLNTETE